MKCLVKKWTVMMKHQIQVGKPQQLQSEYDKTADDNDSAPREE